MKTKLGKYFYDDPWAVLTFAKRNRGIIYNGRTKKYQFYTLKDKPAKPAIDVQASKYKNVRPYPYKIIMFLAGALGASLAFNVYKLL